MADTVRQVRWHNATRDAICKQETWEQVEIWRMNGQTAAPVHCGPMIARQTAGRSL